MMSQDGLSTVHAQGGGYGPPPGGGYAPPGGYGQPGGYGAPPGAPMAPPGGAPMAPPGGMGAPMPGGGGADPQLAKSLQTWFIISILSIFCGCGCLAAVPIYMTYAGKQAVERGDVADAQSKLKIAKICVILGVIFEIIMLILYVVYFVLMGGMAAMGNM